MTLDELKFKREVAKTQRAMIAERTENRYHYLLDKLGIQPKEDIEFVMLRLLGRQIDAELTAINKLIKDENIRIAEEQKAVKAEREEQKHEAFDRMMRGNYNTYGGKNV